MNRGQKILAMALNIENKENVSTSEGETKITNMSRTPSAPAATKCIESQEPLTPFQEVAICSNIESVEMFNSLNSKEENTRRQSIPSNSSSSSLSSSSSSTSSSLSTSSPSSSSAGPLNDAENDQDEESEPEPFSSGSECDRTYQHPTKKARRRIFSSSSLTASKNLQKNLDLPAESTTDGVRQIPRSRKRSANTRRPIIAKNLRNLGQEYVSVSKSKRIIEARKMGPSCGDHCRLKCRDKIPQAARHLLFEGYWGMGSLERQREFIARSMTEIIPKYQYKKINSNKKSKHSFTFNLDNAKVKVCKIFF
ncbi:putative protein TPRXL isoform X2 [Anthonomus grandis grandis]|uniref:putative protein TPRXL isoform X2 n=1 Tax=Anthonomus grandis grandis TaxID=2921223 RepID=UPI0021669E7F|nr:putative protein TPRXL isoform X2 [Anthonomus grandis grandis]XP_050301498.1 putative protein TPRXL isoform X2 [Anthonomus grandis grandis]